MGRTTKLILVFLSIAIVFVSVMLSFIVVLRFHNRNEVDRGRNIQHTYRFYRTDTVTKESSVGFTTLNDQLLPNGFLFFKDEENLMLISDFGTTEYECTGTCSCQAPDNHRKSTNILKTSQLVNYLCAAVSTIVAVRFAKNYFVDECEKTMMSQQQQCLPNSEILSEVLECKSVHQTDEEMSAQITSDSAASENEKADDELEGAKRKFQCMGECLPSDLSEYNKFRESQNQPPIRRKVKREFEKNVKKFNCEMLKITTGIEAGIPSEEMMEKEGKFNSARHYAEYQFMWVLNDYCTKNSLLELDGFKDFGLEKFPQCVGIKSGVNYGKGESVPVSLMNPTIHCVDSDELSEKADNNMSKDVQ